MNTARMSIRRQWRNFGVQCARREWPVEKALTGKVGADALIRDGFQNPDTQRTEAEMADIIRMAVSQSK